DWLRATSEFELPEAGGPRGHRGAWDRRANCLWFCGSGLVPKSFRGMLTANDDRERIASSTNLTLCAMDMSVSKHEGVPWLLLTFALPAKRASQRVEVWRKLQRYGGFPLGNSGYLLPNNPVNQERFEGLSDPQICRRGVRTQGSVNRQPSHSEAGG